MLRRVGGLPQLMTEAAAADLGSDAGCNGHIAKPVFQETVAKSQTGLEECNAEQLLT